MNLPLDSGTSPKEEAHTNTKASLVSRMARVGHPLLPSRPGNIHTPPTDSESEVVCTLLLFSCVICFVCTLDQISQDMNFRDFNFEGKSIKFGKHNINSKSSCDHTFSVLHFLSYVFLYTHLRRKSQEEMPSSLVVLCQGQ